jgi:hypothetical protein
MENYASTFIESIADRRHRNVERGPGPPCSRARRLLPKKHSTGVIDLIAKDVPDLLHNSTAHRRGQEVETRKLTMF